MNDRTRVNLTGIISALVIITLLLWVVTVLVNGGRATVVAIPAMIIAVMAIVIFIRRYRSLKGGFPLEDERSSKIMTRALANAYLISIYWLLAIGWASDSMIEFRDVSQAMSAGILGMAVIFGLCYLYVSRKGDLE